MFSPLTVVLGIVFSFVESPPFNGSEPLVLGFMTSAMIVSRKGDKGGDGTARTRIERADCHKEVKGFGEREGEVISSQLQLERAVRARSFTEGKWQAT